MPASKTMRLATALFVGGGTSFATFMVLSSPAGAAATSLTDGQTLTGGQELVSGSYKLEMQTDGNLVQYTNGIGATWQTYTSGEPGNYLTMQSDGNLVMYGSGGQVRWSSGTAGFGGDYLTQQSDGNIVVYDGSTAVWAKSWTEAVNGEQAYAVERFPDYGWSNSQWGYLDELWQAESGWQWDVCNGGATYPNCNYNGVAYGIPQSLPGDKMAANGSDWATDGLTQIVWGEDYIASTYGTPQAAWAHEEEYHWYIARRPQ